MNEDKLAQLTSLYGQLALANMLTANQVAALKATVFHLDSRAQLFFEKQLAIEAKTSQALREQLRATLAGLQGNASQSPS